MGAKGCMRGCDRIYEKVCMRGMRWGSERVSEGERVYERVTRRGEGCMNRCVVLLSYL